MEEAEHDLQPGGARIADDVVELREIVVARLDFDFLPVDLLGHPVEAGLSDIADHVGPGDRVVMPQLHLEAVAEPVRVGGRRRLSRRAGGGQHDSDGADETSGAEQRGANP